MKQFFKFMLASMLGVFLSMLLLGICFLIFLAALFSVAGKTETVSVRENSVLVASFDRNIPDRSPASPFSGFSFSELRGKITGLNDILNNIRKAGADKNIRGIYLDLSYIPAGMATVEEIRNALIHFKESGKFIIAYGEGYSQTAYYLATAADSIYIHPEGSLDFSGFGSELVFFKGALEKLDIEPQVVRVGTYKSAVEPFTEDRMSDANRLQMTSFLHSLYGHFLDRTGKSRNIPPDSLYRIADSLLVRQPSDALRFHLVDGLKYKDEIIAELKERTGIPADRDLRTVSLADYTGASPAGMESGTSEGRIAVVYASGEIIDGEGNDFLAGSRRISRAIRKVREDDRIKAIVLRVNSPGGSALASDVIWREVSLAKKEKPIVVSMGDVAASGGYYISCAASKIVAQPNTVTGSIGVFAIIPNMQGFFNNKLGITFDGVKTGRFADMGNITRPLDPDETAIIQDYIDDVYADFTEHVAEGRSMRLAEVDSIAQGRIWSGQKALDIGLVDTLGGLSDALRIAAGMAGLKDYRIREYPEQKGPIEELINVVTTEARTRFLREELGEHYRYFEKLKQLPRLSGIQARLPFDITVR